MNRKNIYQSKNIRKKIYTGATQAVQHAGSVTQIAVQQAVAAERAAAA
jgi:hypothetical protein